MILSYIDVHRQVFCDRHDKDNDKDHDDSETHEDEKEEDRETTTNRKRSIRMDVSKIMPFLCLRLMFLDKARRAVVSRGLVTMNTFSHGCLLLTSPTSKARYGFAPLCR
jgi:hypothetical protein